MAKPRVARIFSSVFFKVIAMMALTVAAVSAMLLYQASVVATNTARDGLFKLAEQSTEMVAQRAAGAVRFGRRDDLQTLLESTMTSLNGSVTTAIVLNGEGALLARHGGAASRALSEAAARARSTGAATLDRAALVSAEPVFAPDGATVIGSVAVLWDHSAALAEIAAARNEKILGGMLMALAAFVLCGFAVRAMISRPLAGVQAAMRGIASGDYAVPIPALGRADEIGGIAEALATFRDELRDAAAASRDALFRGAGFEGSSAGLVLVDPEGRITHANPAFQALAKTHASAFPGLPIDGPIEGVGLEEINPAFRAVATLLTNVEALPATRDLVADDHHFEVHVNAIRDPEGAVFGAVLEWADVTARRLNRAILDTLDTHQVKAEFAPDGALLAANDAYRAMIGDGAAQPLPQAIRDAGGAIPLSLPEARFGDFSVTGADGRISQLHGGVCPVRNRQGALMRLVVIGDNVTEMRMAMARAEAEREALT